MENEKTMNNEIDVMTDNGTQNQAPDRYKRPIVRAVSDGKVSVTLENSLREKYGKNFVDEYKAVLRESKENNNNDTNRRKKLINLSAIIREKENPTHSEGTAPETPTTVEEDKKEKIENETDKEYYLRILQRRLELIEEKYGIKFDQELLEFFKSDEYFEKGNIDFLESYDSLGKISKVWNKTDLLNDSAEVIDQVAESNKRAMDVVRNNALKYGDPTLYSQIVDSCEKLENDVEQTKKDALEDEKFYNEQMIKDRVERAILGMAIKNNQDEKIRALAEVLIDSINKRAEYMEDEREIKNYHRNVIIQEQNAKNIEEIKVVKDSDFKLVLLLNERRENRPNSFGPKVVTKDEIKEIDTSDSIDIKIPENEKVVPEEMKKEDYYDVYRNEEKMKAPIDYSENEEQPEKIVQPELENEKIQDEFPVIEDRPKELFKNEQESFRPIEKPEPEIEKEHVKKLVLTFNKPNDQM